MLGLNQQVTRVVGQRHLVLAFEGFGTGVGLIVTCTVAAITKTIGKLGLGDLNLPAQPLCLGLELDADRR